MKKGYEDVEVYLPSTKDRVGDRVPGALLTTLTQCHVIPRMLGEDSDRGNVILDGYQVIAPPPAADVAIPANAEAVVRGVLQQIDGQVGDFRKKGRKVAVIFMTKRYGT